MTGSSIEAGPLALRLGVWLSKLQYEDIPAAVLEHTKICLLDGIGCGLHGAQQPWGVSMLIGVCPGRALHGATGRRSIPRFSAPCSSTGNAISSGIRGLDFHDIPLVVCAVWSEWVSV